MYNRERKAFLQFAMKEDLMELDKARLAIYGLRRSGNHAITEWLLKNLSGKNERHVITHRLVSSGDACYLNAINEYMDSPRLTVDYMFAKQNFSNLIITYEDVTHHFVPEFSSGFAKLVIIRDIEGLLASRYKQMINTAQLGNSGLLQRSNRLFGINGETFEMWKSFALSTNEECLLIKFEEWVASKDYRDDLASKLGLDNIDITDTIADYGGGSSFSVQTTPPTAQELANRASEVELPESIRERIYMDDISNLRKQLGYL